MAVVLGAALDQDFDFWRRIYFGEMNWAIDKLQLNSATHEASFRQQWNSTQVRIIVLEGTEIAWLQIIAGADQLFLAREPNNDGDRPVNR
jgi:hypothetical protein